MYHHFKNQEEIWELLGLLVCFGQYLWYSVQFSEHVHRVFIWSGMIKQNFISKFTSIYQSLNPGGKLRKTLLAVKTMFIAIRRRFLE